MKKFLTLLLLIAGSLPAQSQYLTDYLDPYNYVNTLEMDSPGQTLDPAATSLLTGLQIYYKLEDTTDSYGSNHLTNRNGVTFGPGRVNNAAIFNRTAMATLTLGDNETISVNDVTSFQFVFFIYPTNNTNAQALISKRDNTTTGTQEYLQYFNPASSRTETYGFNSTTGLQVINGSNLNQNAWNMLSWGYNATTNKIFVQVNNGTITEATKTVTLWNGTATFRIGSQNITLTTAFSGRMDELGFWKGRNLTADELTYLWNEGNGRTLSGGVFQ